MASRFPSGQDDYPYNQSTYIYQPKPSSSSRSFPARSHSPAASRSYPHTAYPTPRTTTTYTSSRGRQTRQYETRDRDSTDYYRSSNHTQHLHINNNRNASRHSPLPRSSNDRGTHKSPRGRQWTPRYNYGDSDLKPSPHYSEYTPPRANRSGQQERSYSRYPQTQREASSQNIYHPPYRERSSPSSSQRTPNSRFQSADSSYSPGNRRTPSKTHSRVQKKTPPIPPPSSAKKEVKLTESTKVKEQCSICLNDVTDKASLDCGHSFCYECLVKWCATKETCPLCRTKITQVKEVNKGLPNQRMHGTYRCSCGNHWKSTYTYNGIKQGCRVCGQEVEAHRKRLRRQTGMQSPNILGLFPIIPEKNSTHRQELCGMCKLLGRDCSRPDNSLDDEDLLDIVALENLMSLFNLSESGYDPDLHEDDVPSLTFSDTEDWSLDEITHLDIFNPEHGFDYHYDYDYDSDRDFDIDEDSFLNLDL